MYVKIRIRVNESVDVNKSEFGELSRGMNGWKCVIHMNGVDFSHVAVRRANLYNYWIFNKEVRSQETTVQLTINNYYY